MNILYYNKSKSTLDLAQQQNPTYNQPGEAYKIKQTQRLKNKIKKIKKVVDNSEQHKLQYKHNNK